MRHSATVARREEITTGATALRAAREALESLNNRLTQVRDTEAQVAALQRAVDQLSP